MKGSLQMESSFSALHGRLNMWCWLHQPHSQWRRLPPTKNILLSSVSRPTRVLEKIGLLLEEDCFFFLRYACRILVYASGSSGTFLTYISDSSLGGSHSAPALSVLGCWKMDTLVPRNDVWAVVAVGLWFMLSTAAVVNNYFLKIGGHITPSCTYCATTASPNYAEMCRTLSHSHGAFQWFVSSLSWQTHTCPLRM